MPQAARAAGAEGGTDPQLDPAPCLAAATTDDKDRIVTLCSTLIDNEKTARPDRIKALLARAGAFERKQMYDRAIADYDALLLLDPMRADTFNARGELWRKKGDRPRAVADFGAALRLDPGHAAAKANHRSLALELERAGALKAVEGKPSFNCASVRRPVEKAICASPELANLDREIHGSYEKAIQQARGRGDIVILRREQEQFIALRNTRFGKPGYDLQKAMRERLDELTAAGR